MADIHFDTPFLSRNEEVRRLLKESMQNAFKAGVELAVKSAAHAFLIAGDLFDNDNLSYKTAKFLYEQLDRLNDAGIMVFYAAGNHDPEAIIHKFNFMKWPEYVYIFDRAEPEKVFVKDTDGNVVGVVHGAGHESKREGRNLAKAFGKAVPGVPNVGLLHTFVTGLKVSLGYENYAPCSLEDLKGLDYSYWALGHIHKRAEILDKPMAVYPGNLIGRNPNETGPKGAYLVEIEENNGLKINFHELSPIIWDTVLIDDISDAYDFKRLEDKIYSSVTGYINEKGYDKKLILRGILKGSSPLYKELKNEENVEELQDSLKDRLGAVSFELICDDLQRSIDLKEYAGGTHVIGAALKILDDIKENPRLLLSLKPDSLAGFMGGNEEETINYLKSLLDNMEAEVVYRMTGGDGNEV
ncbi:putative metallophosphoesterase YhaO [Oxobacter pfennigii]|uniref:Putative metallophosphoesterase YhaO n=2 Tax=Oxobacter pfennigii TaxID=36849 RepID=A0A0P8YGP7_9CLOT|nr:putative metallophosphoesterase YhaO [Oxobacter pfennigii]